MEASDELLTIAELAIGLAGFSDVVVAFNRGEGLGPTDRFRFIALLTAALSVLVNAAPLGLHHAGQTEQTFWTGSSAVQMVFWILILLLLGVRFRPEFDTDEQRSYQRRLPQSTQFCV